MNPGSMFPLQILLISVIPFLAAVGLLWFLLLGIRILFRDRRKEESQILREQAAAVAVSIALAAQEEPGISHFPTPPTAIISAWQLSTRTRQMRKGE